MSACRWLAKNDFKMPILILELARGRVSDNEYLKKMMPIHFRFRLWLDGKRNGTTFTDELVIA